jgi:drug/metabolite transporter (DMT)-like permease
VVAAICGAYPAASVGFSIALGRVPSAPVLGLTLLVIAGVVTVARAAPEPAGEDLRDPRAFRRTVAIAVGAMLAFAFSIMVLAEAAARVGELEAVAMGRWVSLAAVLAAIALAPAGARRGVPAKWWPVLLVQGILDGAAYVALAAGSQGEGGVLAAVVGSAFSAVTVILARIVLAEAMSALQWLGLAAIAGGVMALGAVG